MLSDAGITLFGYTVTATQLFLIGAGLLCVGLLLALARGRRIALQRSIVTDELAVHLARIASAVEQLASEATARRIVEEKLRMNVTLPPAPGEEKHPISYSMFGR
ncbi:MAG TPA: hypothetical protein VKT53_03620 [Candidatus Acidoferrum sp.]|nr:hypothetical protein [Candidatus Acidoferrum sp.]